MKQSVVELLLECKDALISRCDFFFILCNTGSSNKTSEQKNNIQQDVLERATETNKNFIKKQTLSRGRKYNGKGV